MLEVIGIKLLLLGKLLKIQNRAGKTKKQPRTLKNQTRPDPTAGAG